MDRNVLFYSINEKIGLKIFRNMEDRDKSFAIQRYLSLYKLSPKVYFKLYVEKGYSFLTELVSTSFERHNENVEKMRQLKVDCESVGIINKDWHLANIGFNKLTGKFVLIDVDCCQLDIKYFNDTERNDFIIQYGYNQSYIL